MNDETPAEWRARVQREAEEVRQRVESQLQAVADRDGLTLDHARALIERWAWPISFAIPAACDKAIANHPDWQTWCDAQRDSVTWESWQAYKAERLRKLDRL